MKRLVFILFVSFACINSYADDVTRVTIQKINSIKADSKYIFAEATNKNWEEALDDARSILAINIEEWLKQNSKVTNYETLVAKSKNNILEIQSKRGSLYRAFVYVLKDDVIRVNSDEQLLVVPVVPDEIENEQIQAADSVMVIEEEPEVQRQLSEEEQLMLTVTDGGDIQTFINGLKTKGILRGFGKYRDIPQQGHCYLYVYDKEKNIVAYLEKNEATYFNLKSLQDDDINNFKGCGAIWFQLNE